MVWSVLPPQLLVNPLIQEALLMMLFAGIIVNVLNLIPCLPLDGGQMMAATVRQYRIGGPGSGEMPLKISVVVSGGAALWAAMCNSRRGDFFPAWLYWPLPEDAAGLLQSLQPDPQFLMIFMGYLCVMSVQQLNRYRSW